MKRATGKNATTAFVVLLALGAFIFGCEAQEDLVEPEMTQLTIEVDPDDISPSWLLVMPNGTVTTGSGGLTLTGVPFGDYTLTWGPAEGWNSPTPNPVQHTLGEGSSTPVVGSYSEITGAQGSIVIAPDPNWIAAPWSVSGPNGFFAAGEGKLTLNGRAVGQYRLSWGDLPGYETPAARTATLEEDGTLQLSDTYAPMDGLTGTITVDPNPDALDPSWTLTGSDGFSAQGTGDQTLRDRVIGEYEITWGDVTGYATPPPSGGALAADGLLQLSGTYVARSVPTGTIRVDPSPGSLDAPWTLAMTGGEIYTGSGDTTLDAIPAGEYTVTWSDLSGWDSPSPSQETKSLEGGQTLVFLGVYRDVNGPMIDSVSGTASNGGSVTISGSAFGTHTLDVVSSVGPQGWVEASSAGTSTTNMPGWDTYSTATPAVVSSARAYSGSHSIDGSIDRSADGDWQKLMYYSHPSSFDKIYATWYMYFQPLKYAEGTQWKVWRITDDAGMNLVDNNCANIYQKSNWGPGGSVMEYMTANYCLFNCPWPALKDCYTNIVPDPYYSVSDPWYYKHHNHGGTEPFEVNVPTPGQWCRQEIFADASDMDVPNGRLWIAINKPGSPRKLVDHWATGLLTHTSDCCQAQVDPDDNVNPWKYFVFQGFWDDNGGPFTDEEALIFYDDIYLQFGTEARVEIGDQPHYESCTRLEILEPTAWSGDSITARVNHGAFTPGTGVYVFVVREDGAASGGWPVDLQ